MVDKKLIKEYLRTKPSWRRKYFCYAPVTTLNFWQNGDVTPCCQNKVPVGRYPEQSIRQIWESEKNRLLQAGMRTGVLPAGCSICEKYLDLSLFSDLKPSQYDHLKIDRKFPTMMEFTLSNTCNLECIMCWPYYSSAYAKRTGTQVDLAPYDSAFTDQLEEFIPHLKETRFFGGEPFLINIYYDIWERIIKTNPECNIIVQTNASVFPEKARHLADKGRFSFSVSIDSLQKGTYEAIRKNASFEIVMNNIDFMGDYCRKKKTYFGISMCPMKLNWKEMPDFVRFCQKKNAVLFYNTVHWPLKLSLRTFSSSEIHDVVEYLNNARFEQGNRLHKRNTAYYKNYIPRIKSWEDDARQREENREVDYDKTLAEMLRKIDEVFVSNTYAENIEVIKKNIVRAISISKDNIDFIDLYYNISKTSDKDFVELIKNKTLEELVELMEEYRIY